MPEALIIDAMRTPIGRYRGALAGMRPDDLGAHAIGAAVERAGLDPADLADVFWGAANQAGEDNRNAGRMASLLVEINEAFAAQTLACARELGIDEERLNVNGGAISIGHPLGCSGARLVTTLVRELRRRGERYGVASLCIGVGQGLATVVENPAA